MKKSFVFISLVLATAACTANPDGTNTDTTTTTSHTTSSSHSGGAGGAGGAGGQGGSSFEMGCADVPDGTFVAKIQLVGDLPYGLGYLAAEGFQSGDTPGTWPNKYMGTDPTAMDAAIHFGEVWPSWFVMLSWRLTTEPDPSAPFTENNSLWLCHDISQTCGYKWLTATPLGCYGHTSVEPSWEGGNVRYDIH